MLRSEVRKASISVNEIYSSIQGEGLFVGTPSLFIRLQGCNLRCPWCDQPSALAFRQTAMALEDLIREVEKYPYRHVVITGGEPFAEESLPLLVEELLKKDKSIQIETNCTLWQDPMEELAPQIHITCSPKAVAGWFMHPKIKQYAKELKFVVDQELSLDVLLEFSDFLQREVVVLQPEGNKRVFLQKALEMQLSLLEMGYQVRVIPQVHKFLGLK